MELKKKIQNNYNNLMNKKIAGFVIEVNCLKIYKIYIKYIYLLYLK